MNTRATVADPGFCYFPDAQGYRPSILPSLPVVNDSALHQQSASPSDTDMLSLTQKIHRLTRRRTFILVPFGRLPDTGAGFGLFQRKRNLFLCITGLFHGDVSLCEMEERPNTSV